MSAGQDNDGDNNSPVDESVQEEKSWTDADYAREFRLEIATSYVTLSLLVMLFNVFPLGLSACIGWPIVATILWCGWTLAVACFIWIAYGRELMIHSEGKRLQPTYGRATFLTCLQIAISATAIVMAWRVHDRL